MASTKPLHETPKCSADQLVNEGLRRSQRNNNPDPIKDLMNVMMSNNAELTATINGFYDRLENKLENLESNFSVTMNQIQDQTVKTATVVAKHEESIETLRRQMNDIEQARIDQHLEIVGIPTDEINANRKEISKLAANIITRYDMNFDQAAIDYAFTRTIRNSSATVIIVVFKSLETKLEVMRVKRESSLNLGIYFNDRLTTMSRTLYQKARQVAKDAGAKRVTVFRGQISIVMSDDSKVKIRWFNDFNLIGPPQANPASGVSSQQSTT